MQVLTKPSQREEILVTTDLEIDLLLCCIRPQTNTAKDKRIERLLQQPIDWAYLIKMAVRHSVMPLLYQRLKAYSKEIPEDILTQLQSHFHANAGRNIFLVNKLLKLLNLFEAHEIPAIPYKGPVIAASVYGSIFHRQFSDLDILVRPQDVPKAGKLLISKGYQLKQSFDREQTFQHEESQVSIDLHWAFTPEEFPCRAESFEALWQRLETVPLAGKAVANLSLEDLLVVLAVQITKDYNHNRLQLSKLCDLAHLLYVRSAAIDWKITLKRVDRLGSEQLFLLGLGLTQKVLGTELPACVIERTQMDLTIQLYLPHACQRLFSTTATQRKIHEICLDRLLVSKQFSTTTSSYTDLIRQLVRFVITPTIADRRFLTIPTRFYFLYYLVRPIRLIGSCIFIQLKAINFA